MNLKEIELSEKRKALNKSLSELIGLLDEVASGADDGFTFTDNDGNKIKLGFDVSNDKNNGILNLDIKQNGSDIFISLVEPIEQMQKELKGGNILNVPRKKK